jgi:hypothetical protein
MILWPSIHNNSQLAATNSQIKSPDGRPNRMKQPNPIHYIFSNDLKNQFKLQTHSNKLLLKPQKKDSMKRQ